MMTDDDQIAANAALRVEAKAASPLCSSLIDGWNDELMGTLTRLMETKRPKSPHKKHSLRTGSCLVVLVHSSVPEQNVSELHVEANAVKYLFRLGATVALERAGGRVQATLSSSEGKSLTLSYLGPEGKKRWYLKSIPTGFCPPTNRRASQRVQGQGPNKSVDR